MSDGSWFTTGDHITRAFRSTECGAPTIHVAQPQELEGLTQIQVNDDAIAISRATQTLKKNGKIRRIVPFGRELSV